MHWVTRDALDDRESAGCIGELQREVVERFVLAARWSTANAPVRCNIRPRCRRSETQHGRLERWRRSHWPQQSRSLQSRHGSGAPAFARKRPESTTPTIATEGAPHYKHVDECYAEIDGMTTSCESRRCTSLLVVLSGI
eukprot:9014036-Pyramimonas_sp.AAC.2